MAMFKRTREKIGPNRVRTTTRKSDGTTTTSITEKYAPGRSITQSSTGQVTRTRNEGGWTFRETFNNRRFKNNTSSKTSSSSGFFAGAGLGAVGSNIDRLATNPLFWMPVIGFFICYGIFLLFKYLWIIVASLYDWASHKKIGGDDVQDFTPEAYNPDDYKKIDDFFDINSK